MSSKKCSGVLENKKICGAETFYNDANGEQCPRECAHCGHILNPHYDEDKVSLRNDGPTLIEFVDANCLAVDYPPQGFNEKPLTHEDKVRIDEMSAVESKYSDLLVEYKNLKASYDKLVAETKANANAKVPKEEKKA